MLVLIAIEFGLLLVIITYFGSMLVSKLDDINAALVSLNESVTAELAAIATAIQNANGSNDPALDAILTQVNALKQRIDDETAALTPPAP